MKISRFISILVLVETNSRYPGYSILFYSIRFDSLLSLIHFFLNNLPPQEDLANGEDIAHCPSCSLIIRVIYDPVRLCLPFIISFHFISFIRYFSIFRRTLRTRSRKKSIILSLHWSPLKPPSPSSFPILPFFIISFLSFLPKLILLLYKWVILNRVFLFFVFLFFFFFLLLHHRIEQVTSSFRTIQV